MKAIIPRLSLISHLLLRVKLSTMTVEKCHLLTKSSFRAYHVILPSSLYPRYHPADWPPYGT